MRNIKLILTSFILILAMVISPLNTFAEFEDLFQNVDYEKGNEIRVVLEGKQLEFDVAPQIGKW